MINHLLTKYHRVTFFKYYLEYSVKCFCKAFQIFLCWNQFRITWQIVIDTQAQLRLSLMSKYPHNYLLNNWLSYKNIQVGTLSLSLSKISSEIEQPLVALRGSRLAQLLIFLQTMLSVNGESVYGKCISRGPSNIQIILTHSVKLSILHLVIGRAFQCVLSLFLGWDKTCFLLLISLFICCRYWKCKLWVDQKNDWDE